MLGAFQNKQHSFAETPDVRTPRSLFDRSFPKKTTFNFDQLVPFFADEVLPGDTINLNVNAFARLATQKVPIMDNLYIDYFFFFVPNRLVYDNWEKLCGARKNPNDSTDFTLPKLTFQPNMPDVGTVYDHMGLPTDVPAGYTIDNTLPFRAYNLIYNDWFRHQDLEAEILVPTDDGPDAMVDFSIRYRNKMHDYFTSCLPWPQKGPAIEIPVSSTSPVVSSGTAPLFNVVGGGIQDHAFRGTNAATTLALTGPAGATGNLYFGSQTGLQVDNSSLAGTINELREAFAIQSLLELDARGGTRYVELVRAHFNVVIPDFRLQRSEYLGGGQTTINSHPVANTTATNQADLAAFATSSTAGRRIGFSKSFQEHGHVIGIMCARGQNTYQQGLDRMWSRSTRYDFYWPELAGLGEQAVLNKEIYTQGTAADDQVFGYNERYAEYRFRPGQICGQFRSTYAQSLDHWHMAEEFGSLPALNVVFLTQNTPIERAISVPSAPHLLWDGWFDYKHARPIPVRSVPVSLGRF